MANSREKAKRIRLQILTRIFQEAKKEKIDLDLKKLCSKMIMEHAISKKTAMEEIDAVANYDFK